MHGYDLRKRLRGDFGLLSSLSFGSLYPALGRLEAAGAVHELEPERRSQGGPPAGPLAVFAHAGSIAGERAAFRARLEFAPCGSRAVRRRHPWASRLRAHRPG